ncbi:hypothetical protein PJ985_14320 [Streptomyces sp. ACA25]|uniref:hypothetical protein n=1 Tax=Streptomyces sp. ACA25 TaxID=3022596 RepID=UPI002308343C|nr:hypothetical protein [Streptomyces sp. ACA25]MDB1088741.1 hypothetical protein [Streptomyces sp. ACA25]
MGKRKSARIVFLSLALVGGGAVVMGLIQDYAPPWLFALSVALLLPALWVSYRKAWVDDLGDFGTPAEEILTDSERYRHAVELGKLTSLLRDPGFREGRFSLGYCKADVDAFLDRVLGYLERGTPPTSVYWITGKQFLWSGWQPGYRHEDVDQLLANVGRRVEWIIEQREG